MKKLLIAGLVFACFPVMAKETISNDRSYNVDKQWTDLKVTQFAPKGLPHIVCVFAREGNAGGISCFPKKPSKK